MTRTLTILRIQLIPSQPAYLTHWNLRSAKSGVYGLRRAPSESPIMEGSVAARRCMWWDAPVGEAVVVGAGELLEMYGPARPADWHLHWTTPDGAKYMSYPGGSMRVGGPLE